MSVIRLSITDPPADRGSAHGARMLAKGATWNPAAKRVVGAAENGASSMD